MMVLVYLKLQKNNDPDETIIDVVDASSITEKTYIQIGDESMFVSEK